MDVFLVGATLVSAIAAIAAIAFSAQVAKGTAKKLGIGAFVMLSLSLLGFGIAAIVAVANEDDELLVPRTDGHSQVDGFLRNVNTIAKQNDGRLMLIVDFQSEIQAVPIDVFRAGDCYIRYEDGGGRLALQPSDGLLGEAFGSPGFTAQGILTSAAPLPEGVTRIVIVCPGFREIPVDVGEMYVLPSDFENIQG